MYLGTDSLDAKLPHHIKGDVIWALGPKAKHEIMRGQRTERHQLTGNIKTVEENVLTHEESIPQ